MQEETEMVKKLYSGMVDREWGRLGRDVFHCLEWDTTWRFLKEYLPERGLVLDAGGGPGRYTIELARQGYDVSLLDLVPANLEWARQEIGKAGVGGRVNQILEGTITDLSAFDNNSFDAVLCLGGPLSHVCPESERLKAVSELVRVARKGAPVFVSVISKYGVLLATPQRWPQAVADPREDFPRLIRTGDSYAFVKDGYCHFFTSAEMERSISSHPPRWSGSSLEKRSSCFRKSDLRDSTPTKRPPTTSPLAIPVPGGNGLKSTRPLALILSWSTPAGT